jgi:hypothetical protein
MTGTVAVGELRAVVVEGDAAPSDVGGAYRRLYSGTVNDAGEVAFSASLTVPRCRAAVVAGSFDGYRVIAAEGDPAPRGGQFVSFGELDLADGGLCLFQATATGSAPEGLFLATAAGVRAVALVGERSPAGPAYAGFAQPTISSWTDGAERRYVAAFVARLADGRTAAVMQPSHASAVVCLTSGMPVDGGVVEHLVISRLGLALSCVATLRRDSERYRAALIVDAGRVMAAGMVAEGAALPAHGRIRRVLRQSAVNVQMGFVAVRLGDGRGALCSLPPFLSGPEVLVCSGDAVPGDGAAVERVGCPVASTGVPVNGPFGVATTVRTTDGREALWLGVFGGQLPLYGEALAPLFSGDRTDDARRLAVHGFRPVKLTNTGALLVRATVGPNRRALLVLDKLFGWYTGT